MRPCFFLLVFITSCQHTIPDDSSLLSNDEVYQYAHKYVNWFYDNEPDSLSQHIYEKSFTLSDLQTFKAKVTEQLGKEEELQFVLLLVQGSVIASSMNLTIS